VDSAHLVRVAVVEDHPLYRFALAELLDRHASIELVGCWEDGLVAREAILEATPDVALIDLDLPGMDGLSLVRALVLEAGACHLVVLSATRDGGAVYDAMAAGAEGFLSKDLDGDAICAAVLLAAEGETVVSRHLQPGVVEHIRAQGRELERVRLTDREVAVLTLAAEGCSNNEIAGRLYVGDTTIKTHLANLYAKLGVSDRAAAVAQAMKRDLIDVSVPVSARPPDRFTSRV